MKVEEVFKKAKNKKMELMIKSVYRFNTGLDLNKKEENLLIETLDAMTKIDRKYFCDNKQYADTALPIGEGQTISQPSTVARMIVLAGVGEGEELLEVGTGSGWNAAILSYLVGEKGKVESIERISILTEKARANINMCRKDLGDEDCLRNINLLSGNIFYREDKKEYDRIIFTAGIEEGGESKVENIADKFLKEDGRLVCPYKSGPILIYDNKDGELTKKMTDEKYSFVSLIE